MVARWVLERVLHKWPELRYRMAVRLQQAWRGYLARQRMGKWYLLRLRHVYHIAKVNDQVHVLASMTIFCVAASMC